MATDLAIANVTAVLHELFPGKEITPVTLDAWAKVFGSDWSDEELLHCAHRVAKEPGRKFFPTPGEIAAHRPPPPSIDTDALLDRIAKLGHHNAATGWQYPTPLHIRDTLGTAVADAYTDAGCSRCFAPDDKSGSSITRDIARRAFADAISAAHRRIPGGLKLPAPAPVLELTPESHSERRQLSAGKPADVDLKKHLTPPSFPTTTRGRVAIGIAYATARAKAVQEWAEQEGNAAQFSKIAHDVAIDFRAKELLEGLVGASTRGIQNAINIACGRVIGFPDFDAWCGVQGYVIPPRPPEPPPREPTLEEVIAEADRIISDAPPRDVLDEAIDHMFTSSTPGAT